MNLTARTDISGIKVRKNLNGTFQSRIHKEKKLNPKLKGILWATKSLKLNLRMQRMRIKPLFQKLSCIDNHFMARVF